jgi:hypothetical protein
MGQDGLLPVDLIDFWVGWFVWRSEAEPLDMRYQAEPGNEEN